MLNAPSRISFCLFIVMILIHRSIVAVPAVGAHPKRTWTDGKTNWLEDLQRTVAKTENAKLLLYDHLTDDERSQPETA